MSIRLSPTIGALNATFLTQDAGLAKTDDAVRVYFTSHLSALSGAAASQTQGRPAILFDQTANEWAAGEMPPVPDHWATMAVDIRVANWGAGSGNVRWRVDYAFMAEGANYNNAPTLGTTFTWAAGTQYLRDDVEALTDITVATGNLALRVNRFGADAGDTLANDAGLFGVTLRKLT